MTHNQELPLSENNQATEKRSDFKKLLLAKLLSGNLIFFLYKQTNNIAGSSDWAQNVHQKFYLNLQSKGLQLN